MKFNLMMKSLFTWLALCFLVACNQDKTVQIEGQLDYVGSAEIFISKKPVHYKYADKIRFHLSPTDEKFSISINVDSSQVIHLHIDTEKYPLIATPGQSLNLEIKRAKFPLSVDVLGYLQPYDSLLNSYLIEESGLIKKINRQLPSFRKGDSTNIIQLYKKRYQTAQKYFRNTPLNSIARAAIGEYLVKRLEKVKYNRKETGFDPEEARHDIIQEAKSLNFFSFESLYAQPSGIRDFTNAFANTFGVADSLEATIGQELMQYDIKRLGYSKLNAARTSILEFIQGRRAKAYSRMHLVAERIGEMPLETSTSSYHRFLQDYEDFPRYTSFLKNFYHQIKRVSPGQAAVPFSLPNADGEIVRMKDFLGKYVLLDFWAGWCIPCLDEFEDMNEIYAQYSRDEFEIVAISIEEDSLRWRQSLQRFKNPWPQLYGGNGFQQQTFRAYRGGGIPFYILVGPDGNIIRYNDIRPSFNLPMVLDSLIDNNSKS